MNDMVLLGFAQVLGWLIGGFIGLGLVILRDKWKERKIQKNIERYRQSSKN